MVSRGVRTRSSHRVNERATMENRREVDRSGHAGLRREDGTSWRRLGIASLALMLVLAAAWVTRRRGQGERIAAAEALLEPKPVIY